MGRDQGWTGQQVAAMTSLSDGLTAKQWMKDWGRAQRSAHQVLHKLDHGRGEAIPVEEGQGDARAQSMVILKGHNKGEKGVRGLGKAPS